MKVFHRLAFRIMSTWRLRNSFVGAAAGIILSILIPCRLTWAASGLRLDVNDASFLWPIPDNVEAVENLIALDSSASDGDILSEALFKALMAEAQTVKVGEFKIGFPASVTQRHTWKVVG